MRVAPGMEGIKGSLEGRWGGGDVNLGPLDVSVWTICRICEGVACVPARLTLVQNMKSSRGQVELTLQHFVENTTRFSKNTPTRRSEDL